MRAPEAGAQEWVATTARSGLRIERNCWATPFTRRLTRRLALVAPATLDDLDVLVHDGSCCQWATIHVAAGVAAITDTARPDSDSLADSATAVDLVSGTEDYSGVDPDVRRRLGDALACPTGLDWVAELDDFWRQHGKGAGMPTALEVHDTDGRCHSVGAAGTAFEIHADSAVLGRVFSGDMLFDEALFAHLLRIVGGLADVSTLIGATMREAYDDFGI